MMEEKDEENGIKSIYISGNVSGNVVIGNNNQVEVHQTIQSPIEKSWNTKLFLENVVKNAAFSKTAAIYIALRLHKSLLSGQKLNKKAQLNFVDLVEDDLLSFLNSGKRILILGEPGSGKSWLGKRITWQITNQTIKKTGEDIPIFVELSRFGHPERDLRQLIIKATELMGGIDSRAQLADINSKLEQGKLFFVLDGLNEVSSSFLGETVQSIADLCFLFPQTSVIIFCRNSIPDSLIKRFSALEFEYYSVNRLTDKEISAYLNTADLYDEFRHKDWGLFAKTPLGLTLLASVIQKKVNPKNWAELLTFYVSQALNTEQVLSKNLRFGQQIKEKVLMEIAYSSKKTERVFLSQDELKIIVNKYVREDYEGRVSLEVTDVLRCDGFGKTGLVAFCKAFRKSSLVKTSFSEDVFGFGDVLWTNQIKFVQSNLRLSFLYWANRF